MQNNNLMLNATAVQTISGNNLLITFEAKITDIYILKIHILLINNKPYIVDLKNFILLEFRYNTVYYLDNYKCIIKDNITNMGSINNLNIGILL